VACPGAGACGGQFTANTMAGVCEFLGVSPMGSNNVPALDPAKAGVARAAGSLVVDLVRRGVTPRQAKFVVSVVLGKGVRWVTQRRGASGGPQWREAAATHWGHTLVGVAWVLALIVFAPALLPWMSPVLAGLVFSIPFSAITASIEAGASARRSGLFRTPEEIDPSEELRELETDLEREPGALFARGAGVVAAIVDPYANSVHRCLLRDRPNRAQPIREYFSMMQELMLREGPAAMKAQEIFALLNDADSVDRMHREVWSRRSGDLAPEWREALARNAP
jgi:membrane glycosyltransferase